MNIVLEFVPLTFLNGCVIIYSMNQNNKIQKMKSPSLLDRFPIGFEYNKTIQQIKKETHLRTI